MRQIEIETGLRIRFPGRSPEFDEGVETGILAVLMATVGGDLERRIGADALDQVRALADRFGYRLAASPPRDGAVEIALTRTRARPRLTVVSSFQQEGGGAAGAAPPPPRAGRPALFLATAP